MKKVYLCTRTKEEAVSFANKYKFEFVPGGNIFPVGDKEGNVCYEITINKSIVLFRLDGTMHYAGKDVGTWNDGEPWVDCATIICPIT